MKPAVEIHCSETRTEAPGPTPAGSAEKTRAAALLEWASLDWPLRRGSIAISGFITAFILTSRSVVYWLTLHHPQSWHQDRNSLPRRWQLTIRLMTAG